MDTEGVGGYRRVWCIIPEVGDYRRVVNLVDTKEARYSYELLNTGEVGGYTRGLVKPGLVLLHTGEVGETSVGTPTYRRG